MKIALTSCLIFLVVSSFTERVVSLPKVSPPKIPKSPPRPNTPDVNDAPSVSLDQEALKDKAMGAADSAEKALKKAREQLKAAVEGVVFSSCERVAKRDTENKLNLGEKGEACKSHIAKVINLDDVASATLVQVLSLKQLDDLTSLINLPLIEINLITGLIDSLKSLLAVSSPTEQLESLINLREAQKSLLAGMLDVKSLPSIDLADMILSSSMFEVPQLAAPTMPSFQGMPQVPGMPQMPVAPQMPGMPFGSFPQQPNSAGLTPSPTVPNFGQFSNSIDAPQIPGMPNVPVQNFGPYNQQLGEIPSIQKSGVPSPGMPLNQQQDEVTNMLAMFERMRRI